MDGKIFELTGTEIEVELSGKKQYVYVNNSGSGEVLAARNPDITEGDGGVLLIKPDCTVRFGDALTSERLSKIYLKGTGKVQVAEANSDTSPFKAGGKGGGSGGNGKKGVGVYGLPIVTNVLTGNLWEAN